MIRDALAADVPDLVRIAQSAREHYAEAQPQFWRIAPDAEQRHAPFLASLVDDPDVAVLVAVEHDDVVGFVVASLVSAPPVYDPGGPTGFVDDFAVARPELWGGLGVALLDEARRRLTARGAAQLVVVAGQHDDAKRAALRAAGLGVASEWWVQPLTR